MKKAWIENNRVRDIAPGEPADIYHPDVAVLYDTEIPDDIVAGAELVDGVWINPPPPVFVPPPPSWDVSSVRKHLTRGEHHQNGQAGAVLSAQPGRHHRGAAAAGRCR
jgi:hypothetical protein